MAFAEAAEPHLTRVEQASWLDRFELERPNLRRTIDWAIATGEADLGLRMAAASWRFWHQRGPLWEGRNALDQLLALPGASQETRARALSAAGDWPGGMAISTRAVAITRMVWRCSPMRRRPIGLEPCTT